MEPKPIFVSYRRDDGIDTAQLLQLRLENMFGEGSTFLDTDTINPGEEYPLVLEDAVRGAKVVILMVGRHWKGPDAKKSKLYDPNDWVRKELEISLADHKKIILPVLIKNASGNEVFSDLPEHLAKLTKLNYIELRERQFRTDLMTIVPVVERHLALADPLKDLPFDTYRFRFPIAPFKGLEYFREADARIFFGRAEEIRKLYNKIVNDKLLLLYGQSGTGKSSLLFAGLKPRMEFQGWQISYLRREKGINLVPNLQNLLADQPRFDKRLIIVDQLEEILTNQATTLSADLELIGLLTSVRDALEKNCHILLGFRKEYLPDFEKLFAEMAFGKMYLEPLQSKGVLEAIQGIVQNSEAHDYYELDFANVRVPGLIANAVLIDEESHVAPLLQMLLVKMWNAVAGDSPRIFSKTVLDKIKSDSLYALITDQVLAIRSEIPTYVESGLVLDVLQFFTTNRATAGSRNETELSEQYSHVDFKSVVHQLKDKYLLTDTSDGSKNEIRLAHDALAPLIKELYAQSALAGQKASRLLESKSPEINAGIEIEFSRSDLNAIDSGVTGMRRLTTIEEESISESRKKIELEESARLLFDEQQQKERLKQDIEREELNSINIGFSNELKDQILESIKLGQCILITGDRLLFNDDHTPLVNSIFQDATGVIGHHFIPDNINNLIRMNNSRDHRWFVEALERGFKGAVLLKNTFLDQIAAVPFSCCFNFSFDVFLKRVFESNGYPFDFAYYQNQPGHEQIRNITWLNDHSKFDLQNDAAVLYNFFGSAENTWSIPFREIDMYKTISSIQKNDFLPDHIRLIIEQAKIILLIGVNWDAWYVQSLIRWLVSDYNKYGDVYTFKDRVRTEHVPFLRNLPVGLINYGEIGFVDWLYHELAEKDLIRFRKDSD